MACWQILPGRRWSRLRPFLVVLVLAACLFYQTLTPSRTRRSLSAIGNGVLPDKAAEVQQGRHKEVTESRARCFLPSSNLQVWKEIEDAIFKYLRSDARAVILYIPSSGSKQDLQLYQRILTQHSYTVTVVEDRKLNRHEIPNPDELNSWDLFICLSSNKADQETCLNIMESHPAISLQKANAFPQIQHLLCRKEGLCQLVRTFPGKILIDANKLIKPHTSSHCEKIPTEVDHKETFRIIIKVYVLVTSLTPLRAFIHSTGIAWHPPKKKHCTIKLHTFFENFLAASSPQQAFDDVKEAIRRLLLITEVFSQAPSSGPKASIQCSSCFQMLTFDIGFSQSMHPSILEIHEHFDFEADEDSDYQDQTFKETLLDDAFRILLSNQVSSSAFLVALRNVYQSSGLRLFPSAIPQVHFLLHDLYRMVNPEEKLGSILALHWLLSNLLEQLQVINKVVHTNIPRSFPNLAKEMHCSYDKDTLPYIRQIFTSPPLDLNPIFDPKIKEYYSEVPFDVVTVKIRAEPVNCQCDVHLDEKKGPSDANYPLGLGINRVNILVTYESQALHEVVSIYKIIIYREDRPSLPLFDDHMLCGFVQDCGSIIHPEESCGLQPLSAEYLSTISETQLKTCETGDMKGQWIVPCLSCSDNRTCDWRQITWQPHNCQYPILNKSELQQCVERKKVLFIGDSTNRGMMYYLIERVNETLQEWQKAHDMKFYPNVNNGNTFISYSYYPQFWIDVNQRPTFEEALEQLLLRYSPLENTGQTILVVGGVQWLNFNHLHIIQKVLKRTNLSNILVIIKSLGMGFHLPVDGIHSLSPAEVQNLWNENLAILNTAKQYGYDVVDTFIVTMGRYKEFLQGKCGCHFHEVVKSKTSEGSDPVAMTLSRPYALGKYFNNRNNLMKLQAYASSSQSPYHVRGPINQVYSEILLSRICAYDRKVVGM
uniref:Cadherin like and PC-esterase domain containing 1 n=1 Tax=Varanus komodoensis TaxID=61221 RepID=A0A8D2LJW8_VARKO